MTERKTLSGTKVASIKQKLPMIPREYRAYYPGSDTAPQVAPTPVASASAEHVTGTSGRGNKKLGRPKKTVPESDGNQSMLKFLLTERNNVVSNTTESRGDDSRPSTSTTSDSGINPSQSTGDHVRDDNMPSTSGSSGSDSHTRIASLDLSGEKFMQSTIAETIHDTVDLESMPMPDADAGVGDISDLINIDFDGDQHDNENLPVDENDDEALKEAWRAGVYGQTPSSCVTWKKPEPSVKKAWKGEGFKEKMAAFRAKYYTKNPQEDSD